MRALLWAATVCMLAANAVAQPPQNRADDFGLRPPEGRPEGPGNQGRWGGPPPNIMFTAIDVDGDGLITKAELRKAVAALKQLDTDGDGNISLAEVSPASPWGDPAQFVDRILNENDTNGDGKLTADEVPERMQQMLQNADQNGDGEYTRDELTAAMENMRNRFRGGRGGGRFGGGPGAGTFGPRDRRADATAQFMQYDRNGDGRLTADEVPQQAMGALQGGDQNNDGAIDAAELQIIIARMGNRARAIGAGAEPGADPNTFRDPNRRNRLRTGQEN